MCQWWIGEHGVNTVARVGAALPPREVLGQNILIVVAGVSEGPALVDVPQRPDARHFGFEPIVGADVATHVGPQAHAIQAQIVGVGHATGSYQQVATANDATVCKLNTGAALSFPRCDSRNRHADVDVDALGLQHLGDGSRYVGVFPSRQARPRLDDGDLAAEAAKDLRHLKADVPTSDDHQLAGQLAQRQQSLAVKVRVFRQTRNWRHGRARTRVQDDLGRAQYVLARLHQELATIATHQPAVGFNDAQALQPAEPALES